MSSAEKFCLRWNDFESNISVAFREIREEKDFFDCTLSCGTRQIQAHRLILSACSPFFRSILRQNPHQHPLLYLKGVEFTDLQAVLNFMYHGEVNVAQEELNSFLTVAEDLQVKGLTQNKSTSQASPPEHKSEPTVVAPKHRFPKHNISIPQTSTSRPSNISSNTNTPTTEHFASRQLDEDVQEVSMPEVKKEPLTSRAYCPPDPLTQQMDMATSDEAQTMGMQMATTNESYVEEEYDYGEYDDGSGMIAGYQGGQEMDAGHSQGRSLFLPKNEADIVKNIVEDADGLGFSCGLCGKCFGMEKGHCKRHIRNVHSKAVKNLTCDYCQKSYKNYDSLRHHQRSSHGVYKQ